MRNPREFIGQPAGLAYQELVLSGDYPLSRFRYEGRDVTRDVEKGLYFGNPVQEIEPYDASEGDQDDNATALMICLATG
ncbi:MAG: hypothetical protein H6807_04095 [Planctomycetes bacterium]|nr:hypothetical protein [Planctomycetota bacterium]